MGDIHGRVDLLAAAMVELTRLAVEADEKGESFTGVFLGDYIDRGPDSREVVEALIHLERDEPRRFVFLRGNHEAMLLDLLSGGPDAMAWLDFGGAETLRSYGIAPPPRITAASAPALAAELEAAMPRSHLAFLKRTQLFFQSGDFLFVHAGARPDRMISEQSTADMLWYRYYADEQPVHGAVVVHGHTPGVRPISGRWRIGIDTEAYASGNLTLLKLDGERRSFLKVRPDTGITRWEQIDVRYMRALDPATKRKGLRVKSNRARTLGGLSWVSAAVAAGAIVGASFVFWTGGGPDLGRLAPWASREQAVPSPSAPGPALATGAAPVDPRPDLRPALEADEGASSALPFRAESLTMAPPSQAAGPDAPGRPAVTAPKPSQGKTNQPAAGGRPPYQADVAGFRSETDAKGFCGAMRAAGHPCVVR